MPWAYAAETGIMKKWADKYGIEIEVQFPIAPTDRFRARVELPLQLEKVAAVREPESHEVVTDFFPLMDPAGVVGAVSVGRSAGSG